MISIFFPPDHGGKFKGVPSLFGQGLSGQTVRPAAERYADPRQKSGRTSAEPDRPLGRPVCQADPGPRKEGTHTDFRSAQRGEETLPKLVLERKGKRMAGSPFSASGFVAIFSSALESRLKRVHESRLCGMGASLGSKPESLLAGPNQANVACAAKSSDGNHGSQNMKNIITIKHTASFEKKLKKLYIVWNFGRRVQNRVLKIFLECFRSFF